MKHLLIIPILVAAFLANAQAPAATPFSLSLGPRAGYTTTSISRYDAGRMDEAYSPLPGIEVGLQASISVNDWLAIRADLAFMQRSHRMDRNLNYLAPVYTEHINNYVMLPVLADCSFGGERIRGHLLAGAYAGYWLKAQRRGTTYWMTDYYVFFEPFDEPLDFTNEDQRINAGLSFGAAISYAINSNIGINLDALYYYDLTSHHIGSPHLADPRYLNTLSISLSLNYKL